MRPWMKGALALGLLGAAALILWLGDRSSRPAAPEIHFRSQPSPAERQRNLDRRTLALATPDGDLDAPRDPLEVAMAGDSSTFAVVAEFNALRHSPIGEYLLKCLIPAGGIEELSAETGVDLLNGVDRIGLSESGVMVTGNFQDLKAPRGKSFSTWGDHLLLFGQSNDVRQGVLDRLDGRAPTGEPMIPEAERYGDLYASVSPALLQHYAQTEGNGPLAALAAQIKGIAVHADATNDLVLTAHLAAEPSKQIEEAASSMRGLLSTWRLKAALEEQPETAALLEHSSITTGDDGITLRIAMPLDTIQALLGPCPRGEGGSTP